MLRSTEIQVWPCSPAVRHSEGTGRKILSSHSGRDCLLQLSLRKNNRLQENALELEHLLGNLKLLAAVTLTTLTLAHNEEKWNLSILIRVSIAWLVIWEDELFKMLNSSIKSRTLNQHMKLNAHLPRRQRQAPSLATLLLDLSLGPYGVQQCLSCSEKCSPRWQGRESGPESKDLRFSSTVPLSCVSFTDMLSGPCLRFLPFIRLEWKDLCEFGGFVQAV